MKLTRTALPFIGLASGRSPIGSMLGKRLRHGLGGVIVAAATFWPVQTGAITFSDGNAHTVNDSTYSIEGVVLKNGSTLIVEDGAVFGGSGRSDGLIAILDTSTLIVNGGHFGASGIDSGEIIMFSENATVIINAGTFGGNGELSGSVRGFGGGKLTVNGGVFGASGFYSGAIGARGSVATINGGSFGGSGLFSGAVVAESSSLEIAGGTFGGGGSLSGMVRASQNSVVALSGGIFSDSGGGTALQLLYGSIATIEADSFDTTAYDPASGGILGVTFCGSDKQNLQVFKTAAETVTLTPILCDADGDGIPDSADQCPDSLEVGGTIRIGSVDTGVPNITFATGCTLSDQLAILAAAAQNHGLWVSSIAQLTNDLRKQGVLTDTEATAIKSAADNKP